MTTLPEQDIAMYINDFLAQETELLAAPKVACKLSNLLKISPFSQDVVRVVESDMALTARLLRVCNTPMFHARETISSVEEAVARLGFENVLRIVWQISIGAKMCESLPIYGLAIGTLWRHTVTVAVATEELAKLTGVPHEEARSAYTAGLLHDIGKILINSVLLSRGMTLTQYQAGSSTSLCDAELNQLGVTHAKVGAELLLSWGLPQILIQGVAFHHEPERTPGLLLPSLVHLADICAHVMGVSYGWGNISIPLVSQSMDFLKIEASQLEQVIVNVRMRADEIETYLSL